MTRRRTRRWSPEPQAVGLAVATGAWFWISVPYDRVFLDAFHGKVAFKAWNPTRKSWLVHESDFEEVRSLVFDHFRVHLGTPAVPDASRLQVQVDDLMAQLEALRSAVELLKAHNAELRTEVARASGGLGAGAGYYARLHLQSGAPMEVVKAAHRALALLHHPDRGGSTATMQRVNEAYDAIRRERGG